MNLSLVSPAFLTTGLLLLGVPLLIHLLMKKRPENRPFPTLRFLRKAQERHSRRLQMRHVLLLLLRALLVLLVLAAFARPQLATDSAAPDADEPVDAVLLVDPSASMLADAGTGPLLHRARAFGLELFRTLPRGSRVAIVADPLQPVSWNASRADLGNRLADLEVSYETSSLTPQLARARQALDRIKARARALYILTDLTLPPLPPGILKHWPKGVGLHVVDLAGQPMDNITLEGLTLSEQAVLPGSPVEVSGVAAAYGRGGRATLDLVVSGRTLSSQPLDLARDGRAPFRFTFRSPSSGLVQGQVKLREKDALEADNALSFSLRVAPAISVLVVTDPGFEASFTWQALRLALDPEEKGKRLAITRVTPKELEGRDLSKQQVVILPALGALPAGGWAALERYVGTGGALLTLLGPGMNLPSWRSEAAQRVLGAEVVGPEQLARPAALAEAQLEHELLRPFRDGKNGDLMSVEWTSAARLVPAAGTIVLARLSQTKLPGLILATPGRGRTLTLAGGLDPRWGDFPKQASLVPFMQEALKYLAELAAFEMNFIVGEHAHAPLPLGSGPRRARVAGPGGGSRVVALQPKQVELDITLDEGPGHYRYLVEAGGTVIAEGGFSANAPTQESDLQRHDPTALPGLLGAERVTVIAASSERELALAAGSRITELTPLIALLLLALMMFESYWSTFRYV